MSCYICNVEGGDEGDFAVLGGRVDSVFVFDGVEMVAFFEIFHEEVRADCGRGRGLVSIGEVGRYCCDWDV